MAKRTDELRDRDAQILNRLAHIEHKVDSIDETNAFALRADAKKHQETVRKIFSRGKRRAQVYLAADGNRGVAEIARHLGMKAQNVSPELHFLKEEGLLELIDATGRRQPARSDWRFVRGDDARPPRARGRSAPARLS